jgi:hypothetical protein
MCATSAKCVNSTRRKKIQHKASNSGLKNQMQFERIDSLTVFSQISFPYASPTSETQKRREIYISHEQNWVNYSHTQHPHLHTSLLTGLILRRHRAKLVLLRIILLSKTHHLCTTCYIIFKRTKESEFTLRFVQIHHKSTKAFITERNNCTIFKFYPTKLFK